MRDISNVKQEIIAYRKIVSPQRPVLRQLDRDTRRFLTEDLEIYYDDLIDSSEKIWDTLDNYKEVVEALEHTNESLIADRQNRVLRILTVMSATLLPLTFVTGLFGMNVEVPWEGEHARLLVVTAFTVALLGGLLLGLPLGRSGWLRLTRGRAGRGLRRARPARQPGRRGARRRGAAGGGAPGASPATRPAGDGLPGPRGDGGFDLRWHGPTEELAFCGHGTLAAAARAVGARAGRRRAELLVRDARRRAAARGRPATPWSSTCRRCRWSTSRCRTASWTRSASRR